MEVTVRPATSGMEAEEGRPQTSEVEKGRRPPDAEHVREDLWKLSSLFVAAKGE